MKSIIPSLRTPDIQQLLDRALGDQESGWGRGDRVPVEEFLRLEPALRDDAEAVLDLVYHEYTLRQGIGEHPDPNEYAARFPELVKPLMIQFGVDAAIPLSTGVLEGETAADGNTCLPCGSIGGYEILAELGRGGMGVVYKCRDVDLDRVVAVKTIAAGQNATAEQRARFDSEARAVARLKHPHIIAIHAVGHHDGLPYLSLEFAEGGSLSQRLSRGPMAFRAAAELIETVARAVHAAHEAGVIHRDIKPSNVLFTADGAPKVSDFGLAKLLDKDSRHTLTGQPLGTPSYMSPEQAQGETRLVGPPTDIYALGAVLYEALTGRPPFLSESAIETVKLVVSGEVVAPRMLRPDVPRDLETICLKCLQKDPHSRYESAAALADDLRRFMERRTILARRASFGEQTVRWCRRNPRATVMVLLLLGALTIASVSAMVARRSARAARQAELAARIQRDRAEAARNQMFAAANAILITDQDPLLIEEMRPYRDLLTSKGLKISEDILRELPDDPRSQPVRVTAMLTRARLLGEKGERGLASAILRDAVALCRGLVDDDPGAVIGRNNLAELLAELAATSADGESVRSAGQESIEIYQNLVRGHHQSAGAHRWLRGIAMNYYNVGQRLYLDTERAAGASVGKLLREAAAQFEEGAKVANAMIEMGGEGESNIALLAKHERYLCRCLRRIAGSTADKNQAASASERAEEHGRKAVVLFEQFADRKPEKFDSYLELALTQEEFGLFYLKSQQWQSAADWLSSGRKTLKGLAKRHGELASRMVTVLGALAEINHNLAIALQNINPIGYCAGARREIETETYEICDKLGLVRPLYPVLRSAYAQSCVTMIDLQEEDGERPELELFRKSERVWKEILRDQPASVEARGMLVMLRRAFADALDDRGRGDEGSRVRALSVTTAEGDPGVLYALAENYAFNAALFGKWPTKLNDAQVRARCKRYSDEAVSMLHEAVAAGFKDSHALRASPWFIARGGDERFVVIAQDLEFPGDPFAIPLESRGVRGIGH